MQIKENLLDLVDAPTLGHLLPGEFETAFTGDGATRRNPMRGARKAIK